jgi:hypothetical protein
MSVMNIRVALMGFVLAACLAPVAFSQDEKPQPQRNSIDWFHHSANSHAKKLLFKVLQFTAPYPGYYLETSLDTNGNVFSARIVPDWAVQGSRHAKLDSNRLNQVRQILAQLNLSATPADLKPQQAQLHTALVFYDGHTFSRFNYNGALPAEIEAILALIENELAVATEAQSEEVAAQRKLLKATYGDWQNRNDITIAAGAQMHGCKGNRAALISMAGQRKTPAQAALTPVSVYNALVIYPLAAVTSSGNGGRLSDDPVSSYVMLWTPANASGSFSENTSQQKLEILHNAIDASISIAGKTYELKRGNMFIIRIGDDWVPTVTQLNEISEEQVTQQVTLDRFKSALRNDSFMQKLELY